MWVLVIGSPQTVERPDGGAAVLRDLGCQVETCDLWEGLDDALLERSPPAAILVEALDQVDAARASLVRIRSAASLAEVPVLVAVTVGALQRIQPADAFDDLVLAPYVPVELYVRVRRAEWKRSEFENHELVKIGALVIDVAAHEVSVEGRRVTLTNQEFELLKFLATNRGRVFSRNQLLERVWGVSHYAGSRTVDIHVRRLRMKIGKSHVPIETVRGAGYKMKAP